MGEIMFRGNIVMKGYLKNPAATAKAFAGGWFHTGDLAVMEPDRYVKIKDRSKDIIISGGENISSDRGGGRAVPPPAVMACAGGGAARREVGRDAAGLRRAEAGRERHGRRTDRPLPPPAGRLQGAQEIRFEPIPKTSTGKIQKFQLRSAPKSASPSNERVMS